MTHSPKDIDTNLFVLVSNQVAGPEGIPVAFAFRTKAADDQDSGWNFWSGEETEEYVSNAENFSRFPLKRFLTLDKSLQEIVNAKVGTSWEKDEESDSWIESQD